LEKLLKSALVAAIVVSLLRKFGPQLREQRMRRMTEMLDRLPDDFPPIRAMRDLAEIRRTTERIVELLEQKG
jgi:hypothetical protein